MSDQEIYHARFTTRRVLADTTVDTPHGRQPALQGDWIVSLINHRGDPAGLVFTLTHLELRKCFKGESEFKAPKALTPQQAAPPRDRFGLTTPALLTVGAFRKAVSLIEPGRYLAYDHHYAVEFRLFERNSNSRVVHVSVANGAPHWVHLSMFWPLPGGETEGSEIFLELLGES